MRYLVRMNPKALNPLTHQIDQSRFWEVEQCATKDSEKVIWHFGSVRIGLIPVSDIFESVWAAQAERDSQEWIQKGGYANGPGKVSPRTTELTFCGIATIGENNTIVIHEGRHESL